MTPRDESGKDVEMQNADSHPRTSASMANRIRRLGMLELGWYAHEKRMPAGILRRIGAGQATTVSNIVTILAKACEQDPKVKLTHLCHRSVQYITKVEGEGSFCGYRNIQMMISYLFGSKTEGSQAFPDGVPSILQLQNLIEDAWEQGFNSEGRLETGGIWGTRKHIGTPEAQALFKALGIKCIVSRHESIRGRRSAFSSLLDHVQRHFAAHYSVGTGSKVHETNLPPIYLQRPRHSLTIIGIQVYMDGSRKLLVLDPGRSPSSPMVRAAAAAESGNGFDERISLSAYKRGRWDLGGYKQFETLTFVP